MASKLNPYLNFRDNAREAMEFYRSVFGGTLTMTTFGEFGMAQDPGDQDKIMHGQLETDSGFTLMGADTPTHMGYNPPAGFAVSLSSDSSGEAELRGYWDKLSEGGNVTVPLEKQMWGDVFGMVTDKFGIDWMVNITEETQG
jgi:PhnB protein